MIQVWTEGQKGTQVAGEGGRPSVSHAVRVPSGVLARTGTSGSSFAYTPPLDASRAVSLTMPARLPSWNWPVGLAPIFDMNLPEGALRARLQRQFAKATGRFDDLDLLAITGRTQLGRLRYSPLGESLDEEVPFQSIDEILRARRQDGLFDFLMERYAEQSGIAGVQPKVLIRDPGKLSDAKLRQSISMKSTTHIVKLWDPREYPELAANEYFCLTAAHKLGFQVPFFELSGTGDALVIERFDLQADGWLGFEDFAVLNGKSSSRKYDGSIETSLFKRLGQFVAPQFALEDNRTLFGLIVLNCALGNGDAHLKNFGLLYERLDQSPRLAPVYDLVTTTAYLPQDTMALKLDGSTRWPTRQKLIELGQRRAGLTRRQATEQLELTAVVLMDLRTDVRTWFRQSAHPDIGEAMITRWEAWAGQALS
jgi:serine/threonine-protein kinase HipA